MQDVVDKDDAVVPLDLHARGVGNGLDDGIHLIVLDDDLQSGLLEEIHLLFDAAKPLFDRRGVPAAAERR